MINYKLLVKNNDYQFNQYWGIMAANIPDLPLKTRVIVL